MRTEQSARGLRRETKSLPPNKASSAEREDAAAMSANDP
jgi:hypothetical protein